MATITEEQRKEYIKEVQTFLRTISQFDERIPRVAVDGIYDEQTADVVGIFQKIAGLPVTNEVDKATFNAIFNAFVAIERINELCDKDSFVEIYSGVRHNCTSFGMEKKDIPYDGVITGFGKINGIHADC